MLDFRVMIAWSGIRFYFEAGAHSKDEAPREDEAVQTSVTGIRDGIRKLQIAWPRTRMGDAADDVAVTTLHLLKVDGTTPVSTWAGSDFTTVEARLATFLNAIRTVQVNELASPQYRWYRVPPAGGKAGAAVRVLTTTGLGGSHTGNALPPQVAVTVTERTNVRRRWGRMYLPGFPVNMCSEHGSILPSACVDFANATSALYSGLYEDDLVPVVWSPTAQAAYTVRTVQVDDLFDVIRSRRWKQPTVRERRGATV
jgi:hypothetical protein